jgi:hypothetical protein
MSLSFAGWTAQEIVGKLTKKEVIACLPKGWIRLRDAQKWEMLEDVVLKLSDNMKGVVYRAACTKAHLKEEMEIAVKKRKRENVLWTRQVRRHLDDGMLDLLRLVLRNMNADIN